MSVSETEWTWKRVICPVVRMKCKIRFPKKYTRKKRKILRANILKLKYERKN